MNLPKYQLEGRDIKSPKILSAIRQVPRELFVPPSQQELAYAMLIALYQLSADKLSANPISWLT